MESHSIYCIYSNKEISEDEASDEHIIPKSLGGSDSLTIKVCEKINKKLGSEIDAKMANDVRFIFKRKNSNARGHSNKMVVPEFPKAYFIEEKKPIHLSFLNNKTEYYDLISNKEIDITKHKKLTIEARIPLNGNIQIRFTAKTLLSAGYYIYGQLFRYNSDHQSLRDIMNLDINKPESLNESPCIFYPKDKSIKQVEMIKQLCQNTKGYSVIFIPDRSCLIGAVGIFGRLVEIINFPADTDCLQKDQDARIMMEVQHGQTLIFKA